MKNTQVLYTNDQRTPTVLPDMKELLPPLSGEQFSALEADILANGCYAPIIVNEEMVVIDRHNRLRICEQHGLPFKMLVFSFEDLLEAKRWALDTQKGRRNLDKWELGRIALKLKPDLEAKAKANQSAAGGNKSSPGALLVNSPKALQTPVDTRKEMALAVGLGEQTMGRIAQIDQYAPEVVKQALDNRELSINQGYILTRQLQELPEDQREQAAIEAIEMEKAKKELRLADAEIDRQHKIALQFSRAFEKALMMTPTEENLRLWVKCSRMTPDEIGDTIEEAYELSEAFKTIGDILRNQILPSDPRVIALNNKVA